MKVLFLFSLSLLMLSALVSGTDVETILAGDWHFTPTQAQILNQAKPELLAPHIYNILNSIIGVRMTKWGSDEPLDVDALKECQFVDLHHSGEYVAIALIEHKIPLMEVIEKINGKCRVDEGVNYEEKLTYPTPEITYIFALERLLVFGNASAADGYFPRIYDFKDDRLVDVSKQHRNFYLKDFAKDVDILLYAYEGRNPSATPPVTGEWMIDGWKRMDFYGAREEAVVGLAEAMLKANRLFAKPVLPKQSFVRINTLLTDYSPVNVSPSVRKLEPLYFGPIHRRIWKKTKKNVAAELLRYK